jgi:hypothetical protein
MMSVEQVRELDKRSDPQKLLPTTIEFLKQMREVANFGRSRRGEPVIPWTAKDERRF